MSLKDTHSKAATCLGQLCALSCQCGLWKWQYQHCPPASKCLWAMPEKSAWNMGWLKQPKCLWGWVSQPLPYTDEYSVFTLFQMGQILWLTIWFDFTELRKGLASWKAMICNCLWCLYYLYMASLVIINSRQMLLNPFKMRPRPLPLTKETFKDRFSLDEQRWAKVPWTQQSNAEWRAVPWNVPNLSISSTWSKSQCKWTVFDGTFI